MWFPIGKFSQHWQLVIAHEGTVKGEYQWENNTILKEADCLCAVSSCLLKNIYYKSNHKTFYDFYINNATHFKNNFQVSFKLTNSINPEKDDT